jgi:hypothetical protein
MRRGILLCALAAAAASAVVTPISFQDIAPTAGIRFVADNSATPQKEQPEGLLAGVALFDYDGDGYLDIYFVNGAGMPSLTKDGAKHQNHLFHNNRNLTFTDVTEKAGLAGAGSGMGIAIADYDGDGFTDVFVANDDAPFQLFHNLGGKRFEEVALDAGVALPENGNVISGMGVDFRDVFNKGLPSLWVTAIEKETFPLLSNSGKGQFEDKTAAAGLAMDTYEMSGWSNAIVDLDNDGWKDLLVVRSNVQDNISQYSPRKYEEPGSVFRNLGSGKFQNVTAAAGDLAKPAAHRGMAVGDLDNDGRMDAVATVLNGPARVFHNTTQNGNHWLLLKLAGTKSNRMGIGAKLRVTLPDGSQQFNHVTTSTGYASSSDSRVHFGLGAAATAKEIEVVWPGGIRQTLRDVTADRVVTVTEPAK